MIDGRVSKEELQRIVSASEICSHFDDQYWMAIELLRCREPHDTVIVLRGLAERTEAMFRSVDPQGHLAIEWLRALRVAPRQPEAQPAETAKQRYDRCMAKGDEPDPIERLRLFCPCSIMLAAIRAELEKP